MKKYILIFMLLLSTTYGAIWSLTMMGIATTAVKATLNTNMKQLNQSQQSINSVYEKVRQQEEAKKANIEKIAKLDKYILLELKAINNTAEKVGGIKDAIK